MCTVHPNPTVLCVKYKSGEVLVKNWNLNASHNQSKHTDNVAKEKLCGITELKPECQTFHFSLVAQMVKAYCPSVLSISVR